MEPQSKPQNILILFKFVSFILKKSFREFPKVGKFNSINQFISIKNIFINIAFLAKSIQIKITTTELYLFTGKKASFFELEPQGTEYVC